MIMIMMMMMMMDWRGVERRTGPVDLVAWVWEGLVGVPEEGGGV